MESDRPRRESVLLPTASANRPAGARPLSQVTNQERIMSVNKDQIAGTAKDVAGKVQQEVGKLVGRHGQQAKGLAKQVEGKVQKRIGDLKEVVADLKHAATK
jgi:uncharacterized protein YjbJ (UPF0337 family)